MNELEFGKLPPQAKDLEEAVLGAIMIEDCMDEVSVMLKAEHFYVDAHKRIFRAIKNLFENQEPIDLLTVSEKLRRNGELESAGGPFYVAKLTNKVGSAANVEYHARIIKEMWVKRAVIASSSESIKEAYEDTYDAMEVLEKAEKGLGAISAELTEGESKDFGSVVIKQVDDITYDALHQKEKKEVLGLPTGIYALDRKILGFNSPDLIIGAARPGEGKCLGKGTKVIMFDGKLKNAENVKVGDKLMGPDSKPKTVLALGRGREMMYWVRQNRAIDYRVNESHILCLKASGTEYRRVHDSIVNISVGEYNKRAAKFKLRHKGWKCGFEMPDQKTIINPYLLGVWLGDGCSSGAVVFTTDSEIVKAISEISEEVGYRVNVQPKKSCLNVNISKGFKLHLRTEKVLDNKHIPHKYIYNSRANRLSLLAGLIDTDGHLIHNGFEITQKNERLARDIKYLADTLGFKTSINSKVASIRAIGFSGTVWRVRINGSVEEIPCRIPKKKCSRIYKHKSVTTGIIIEKDVVDDYYGFELDGDGLFLLEDGTVTHNTSFALQAADAILSRGIPLGFISAEMRIEQLNLKLLSLNTGISVDKLRKRKLNREELDKLEEAKIKLAKYPLVVWDKPCDPDTAKGLFKTWKKKYGIEMGVVDYIQRLKVPKYLRGQNSDAVLTVASNLLKDTCLSLEMPLLCLSQMSREVEGRVGAKSRPQLTDLRGSGSLEQDADIVIFIYRPEMHKIDKYEDGTSTKGCTEFIIEKSRLSSTGTIRAKFSGALNKFDDSEFGAFNRESIIQDSQLELTNSDDDLPF